MSIFKKFTRGANQGTTATTASIHTHEEKSKNAKLED